MRIGLVALAATIVLFSAAPARASDGALQRYARDTWSSFAAMTDPASGLPADVLDADGTTSVQTSTTNIGAYMWSAVVAERLGIIGRGELVGRLTKTIDTLAGMERYGSTGQYYNWYDHHTGAKLTVWPPTGAPLTPILSTVDNAWLATGLRIVQRSVPELSTSAGALYDSMDFSFYYEPAVNRVLFHFVPSTGERVCCYDTVVSESRIADYIGIAKGELPSKEYFGRWRSFPSFPNTCDWSWQETRPIGFDRSYYGVDVFEGAYPYNGTKVTPSWGGSMFEALMPALFVPEERWGPGSWGPNHPLTVQAQIHHGLVEAGYGYWGFSPSNIPEGGYDAYGVDAIGLNPDGNWSNEDKTLVDNGFSGCRDAKPAPPPSAYTNGVVTPHAAFLALRYAPGETLANLQRLERDFPGLYGKWGFRDSVNVDAPYVSGSYLSLDQGMIMAALGNALAGDMLRKAFVSHDMERSLRPVLGVEEFGADPRGCTITGTAGGERITGTPRDDVICAGAGDDVVDGRGGDDTVFGDAGNDRLSGGDGDDTLYGDDGDDRLSGGRGDDVLAGGPGDNRLYGGPGDDASENGSI
jgi:hypothetical protein